MNQWSQFLLWNFVYDCMFIAISTDGELEPLAVKQSITCGGRSALSICWWLAANPFSVKQSVIFDRETVNPGYSTSLFYISILTPYIYCLISIIYFILFKSVIYYLLSIIYYLLSMSIIYFLLYRLHCYQLLILSLGGCDATFVFSRLLKTWKLLVLIISWSFSYICYVKTFTIIGEMWAG